MINIGQRRFDLGLVAMFTELVAKLLAEHSGKDAAGQVTRFARS